MTTAAHAVILADPATSVAESLVPTPTTTEPTVGSAGKEPPMSTSIIDNNALTASLRALKLSGMLQTLDARLAQARAGELGHREFLPPRSCPPPRSVTWPRCAGSRPASR